METIYTSVHHNDVDGNLANIIAINTADSYDEDSEDYDLDYDPNDFFYELQVI